MTKDEQRKPVTVFRSADVDSEEQAIAMHDLLAEAGIEAEVLDDHAPEVPQGFFEVRVAAADAEAAEDVVRAQGDFIAVDPSHDLDLVPVFSAVGQNAEIAALGVRGVLDAQNIPSVLISGAQLAVLPFEVRVPKAMIDEARQALAAAEEAGPAAAEEAALEGESGSPDRSA